MTLAEQFREQAAVCRPRSPLYGELLDRAAADLEAGGPTAAVMAGTEHDRRGTVPPLRLMGALHRLVLDGDAPALAPYYSSVGGSSSYEGAWPAVRTVLAEQPDVLRALVRRPVQTNEVGRSAVLYGVLRVLAARLRMPVRLLEIGASAGVNLFPERYAYDVGGRVFGDAAGAVRFDDPWDRDPAGGDPLADGVVVAERAGCDPDALDPSVAVDRRTLESYVWAEQVWRMDRLRTALDVAAASDVRVERASAAAWLTARLAEPVPDRLTVVWHSVVWQYLPTGERTGVRAAVVRAAAAASARAPLAVVGFEPRRQDRVGRDFEFVARMRLWPGAGDETTLAVAEGHGPPVRWLT